MITIRNRSFFLRFRRPFGTAHGLRQGTAAVFVELAYGHCPGYGEAALPPYLADTAPSTASFVTRLDLQPFTLPEDLPAALDYVAGKAPGHYPAKAAVDMALHDLCGRLSGQTTRSMLGLGGGGLPRTTYTIGLDEGVVPESLARETAAFGLLKVKAGGPDDRARIGRIRDLTGKPFCVDANGGWTDREQALDMIHYLHALGSPFVEQPLPPGRAADAEWLKARSPLPLVADESFQTIGDLDAAEQGYSGINIKLMKCGGLHPALAILRRARDRGMKVLIGCMSESTCGVAAAAQLASLADWADLDGPLLIGNDPFSGIRYDGDRIVLSDAPGTAAEPESGFFEEPRQAAGPER